MEIYENLRDLAIIIAVAEVFGLIARKIKLPQVVGQIIAGLLIGPCVLGWAGNTEYISAGLGTNLKTLVKTGPVALLMATMGVLAPMVLGTIITMVFYGFDPIGSQGFYKALFIGVIMTATSVGITVRQPAEA